MSANVESMFYVRQVPWHGLGTMVQEAQTSADALSLAGLDWIVEPKPVYIESESIFGTAMTEVPGFVANTRNTDGQVFGIVSDVYKIIQNADAFAFTDSLIGGDVHYETAGSLSNGKKTWLLARLPETEIVGDKVEQYLVFTNSFDGSSAVRVACTPVRVVCQNTLNLALNSAKRSWSVRHTTNINARLIEARHALQMSEAYTNELKWKAEKLATQHLSNSEIDNLITQLFPIEQDASDMTKRNAYVKRNTFRTALNANDLQNFRNSAWGFVNAAADMADHAQPLKMTANYQESRLANVFSGATLLDRAYELVTVNA